MDVFWVDVPSVRLSIVHRPRGGDWLADDLTRLRSEGVEQIISMLEQDEERELGLANECESCVCVGLAYANFPIQDRSVPDSMADFVRFIDAQKAVLTSGVAVGVHCRASIGRSSLMTAALLLALGYQPALAFELIERARGCPVPDTQEQRSWIENLAHSVYRARGTGKPTEPLR